MVDFCMMIGLGAAQPTNNEQNIEMNLLGIEFMVVWPTVFALAGRWHRADVGIEIPAAADLPAAAASGHARPLAKPSLTSQVISNLDSTRRPQAQFKHHRDRSNGAQHSAQNEPCAEGAVIPNNTN